MSNFSADDLARVFISDKDAHGTYAVRLDLASSEEFNRWAQARLNVVGEGAWSVAERVDFCRFLEDRSGPLYKVKAGDLS